MSITRIGINGFGRIGRQVFKILWEQHPELQIAAIGVTDPTKTEIRAHLLEYDTTYGRFPHTVEGHVSNETNVLTVDNQDIPIIPRLDPHRTVGWADYGIAIVIDATGKCKYREYAEEHLREGAERVIITCPSDWADATIVYGINHQDYEPWQHRIVSSSSCTTTSLAPVSKALDDAFGLTEAFVTTVHAYTNSQSLLDSTHKDPRRARAAGNNIIPTTTGAAKALDRVLPGLGSRIGAAAIRVPVPTVSMIDLVAHLEQPATAQEVNEAFRAAANGPLRGILSISDKPLVSSDYVGDEHSAIVDALSTSVAGQLVRLVAWYDNEWGYSCRVADLTAHIARQELSSWMPEEWAPARVGAELAYALDGLNQ